MTKQVDPPESQPSNLARLLKFLFKPSRPMPGRSEQIRQAQALDQQRRNHF